MICMLAEEIESVTDEVPVPVLFINCGIGGIQSGIGGGPAIGPLGIAGPTPIIHSDCGKYKMTGLGLEVALVIVLTLNPIGLPANTSISLPPKLPDKLTVKAITLPEFCFVKVRFLVVLAVMLSGSGMVMPFQSTLFIVTT